MNEKWKLTIGITLLMIVVMVVTVGITMQLMPVSNNTEPSNPYASIMGQSMNYSSQVTANLSDVGVALQTYYSTGNMTYLANATQSLDDAFSVEREYTKWYMFNVFKEIDDHDIDAQIFDDIYNLKNAMALYLDAVLTASTTIKT